MFDTVYQQELLLPACCPHQCFAYFSLYLKGREELVVTVYHGPQAGTAPHIARLTAPGYGAGVQQQSNALPTSAPLQAAAGRVR